MGEVFDPVLDVPKKRLVIEDFMKKMFGKESYMQVVKGKENIKWDFIVHNAYHSGKSLKGELKTRWPSKSGYVYQDVAVEITQYDNECARVDDLLTRGVDHKDVLKKLETYSTGWLYRSQANFIIQVTKDHIDIIRKQDMKDYIYKHAYPLLVKRKYCGITTGAYNVMVPYDNETKKFIKRFYDVDVDAIYKE